MIARCVRCEAFVNADDERCARCGLAFRGLHWKERLRDDGLAAIPWLALAAALLYIAAVFIEMLIAASRAGFVM